MALTKTTTTPFLTWSIPDNEAHQNHLIGPYRIDDSHYIDSVL
jgi:hypothetical protein